MVGNINWWDSDMRRSPMTYSNVDFYCKLRWDSNGRRMSGPGPNGTSERAYVNNGSMTVGGGPSAAPTNAALPQNGAMQNGAMQNGVMQNGAVPQQNIGQMPGQVSDPTGVQSTPVIQPFVVVPYSTPMQPMYHYKDGTLPIGDFDSDYMRIHGGMQNPMMPGMNPMMMQQGMNPMGDLYYNMDEESERITRKNTRKKRGGGLGAVPFIIMILLALFATLTLFVGSLVSTAGLEMSPAFATSGAEEITLFSSFETLIGVINGKVAFDLSNEVFLAQFFVVVSTVFFAIVFLSCLFSITQKRLCLFVGIMALLGVASMAVALILCAVASGVELGLSAYVLVGIAVLVFLISLLGKKKGKKETKKKK